jgi:Ca2+-binding RTX toxin-like protein
LRGSAFNDTLTGDGNNNVLEGGPGNDTLDGGNGIDTASYEHVPDDGSGVGVTVDLGNPAAQNTVKAGTDTLTSIENLRGSSAADSLTGDANANVLEGGPGGDTLAGGGGNDTASYEHATAGVTANLADPNDAVNPNTGEAFGDSYLSIENLFGSRFSDHLIGDANANILDGGYGGNDVLTGSGGADTFVFHGSQETITDFNHGEGDLIDISGSGLSDTEVQTLIDATSPGSDTIDFGNGNILTLAGVNVHTLITSADFIYA